MFDSIWPGRMYVCAIELRGAVILLTGASERFASLRESVRYVRVGASDSTEANRPIGRCLCGALQPSQTGRVNRVSKNIPPIPTDTDASVRMHIVHAQQPLLNKTGTDTRIDLLNKLDHIRN